jgi:hypothetical protein
VATTRGPLSKGSHLSFHQLDLALDGQRIRRSSWGSALLRVHSEKRLRYFNLSLAGDWVVRNMPIFPFHSPQPQEYLYYLPLGIRPGKLVLCLDAASGLSPEPLKSAPAIFTEARVTPRKERYTSAISGKRLPPLRAAPPPYLGTPLNHVLACRIGYPNQPCGKNECGPAAVSNSLQWLNEHYHLGIDPEKLSINFWKAALQWDGEGVRNGKWADDKRKYIDDHHLPLDSTKESGGHAKQVLAQFDHGQAVEVFIGQHIAAVTCMGVDQDGNYHLVASSDAAQQGQNAAGSPVSQPIVLTPGGLVTAGPPWAVGRQVQNFVVQCPHPGK